MNKREFLAQLRKGLSGLPQDDMDERLIFYGEMIDDQMEDGLSEEEAVSAIGSVEEIVAQVVAEIPLVKITKEQLKPKRRLRGGEILLLALGAPLWLPLVIAAFAVVLSLYLSWWAVVISLWSVFASLAACSVGGIAVCVILAANGSGASGLAMLAAGLVCAGLAIFSFYGCKAITDGTLKLTKKTAIWIKKCFIRKEDA